MKKTIAFTGHRYDKLPLNYDLSTNKYSLLNFVYYMLEDERPSTIISGGAVGFDQLIIDVSMMMYVAGLTHELIIAEPFPDFWNKWPQGVQERYQSKRLSAEKIVVVSENLNPKDTKYYEIVQAMQKRNEWMVNHADEIWAYWDGSKGGTANCVKYAKKVKKPVRNLFEEYKLFKENYDSKN